MLQSTKTPIERMADLLAEMTERAAEAERQRDAAKADAEQWYQNYRNKSAEHNALIKEHEELRGKIEGYIENMEKGAQEKC